MKNSLRSNYAKIFYYWAVIFYLNFDSGKCYLLVSSKYLFEDKNKLFYKTYFIMIYYFIRSPKH